MVYISSKAMGHSPVGENGIYDFVCIVLQGDTLALFL